jgi:hypothetical protein
MYKLESIRNWSVENAHRGGRERITIGHPNSTRVSLILQVGTYKRIEQFLAVWRGHMKSF